MKALTILITGATSGIGRHAALHLASKGHRVIATGRSDRALEDLRKAAPPVSESNRLSVRSWRTSALRGAPMAIRTAISRWRAAACASNRFATLAHAMHSTNNTTTESAAKKS